MLYMAAGGQVGSEKKLCENVFHSEQKNLMSIIIIIMVNLIIASQKYLTNVQSPNHNQICTIADSS